MAEPRLRGAVAILACTLALQPQPTARCTQAARRYETRRRGRHDETRRRGRHDGTRATKFEMPTATQAGASRASRTPWPEVPLAEVISTAAPASALPLRDRDQQRSCRSSRCPWTASSPQRVSGCGAAWAVWRAAESNSENAFGRVPYLEKAIGRVPYLEEAEPKGRRWRRRRHRCPWRRQMLVAAPSVAPPG